MNRYQLCPNATEAVPVAAFGAFGTLLSHSVTLSKVWWWAQIWAQSERDHKHGGAPEQGGLGAAEMLWRGAGRGEASLGFPSQQSRAHELASGIYGTSEIPG